MRKYRLKEITYFDGFALGALITSIFFLVLFAILDFPLEQAAWIGMLGNIVVALFSIGAALFALRGNRLQIAQANDIEDDRRYNSLVAARAVLPAILGEMAIVARNNLMLRFQPGHSPIGFNIAHPTVFQQLPENVIPGLKECIEHADEVSQERLANILRHFQVQQARQQEVSIGLIRPDNEQRNVEAHHAVSDAVGWAVVYGLVTDAFGFARGSAKSIPSTLSSERVLAAFAEAGIVVPIYPFLELVLYTRINENRLEKQWIAAD